MCLSSARTFQSMGKTCTGLRTQVFHVFDKRISCHQLKSASGLHNAETKLHHSIHLIIIQNTEAGATEHYLQYLQLLTQSLILSSQCDSQEKANQPHLIAATGQKRCRTNPAAAHGKPEANTETPVVQGFSKWPPEVLVKMQIPGLHTQDLSDPGGWS